MEEKIGQQICIIPSPGEVGGPTSFIKKFTKEAEKVGVKVSFDIMDKQNNAVLVVGGTKNLLGLWKAKKRGVPIIQRLDGMNWIHRKRSTGIKHFLLAEIRNWILFVIRAKIATKIIYQSQFCKIWWEEKLGEQKIPTTVIHNGINLDVFSPANKKIKIEKEIRILMVEGHFGGGYEGGLENAVAFAKILQHETKKEVVLSLVGDVSPAIKQSFENEKTIKFEWEGRKSESDVAKIHHQSHLLFSGDVNAACPNSVLEAMSSGLPILAYDTGSLMELVGDNAGRIVSYGGNPWNLDIPNNDNLSDGALSILDNLSFFQSQARKKAEDEFSVTKMAEKYFSFLLIN
jgi:glycosyltransferase involved in cell wall biosynthesis